jgi:hypothetical protein
MHWAFDENVLALNSRARGQNADTVAHLNDGTPYAGPRGITVCKVRSLFAAVLLVCAGASEVSAESEGTWEDFKAVDTIGTTWAYSAFLQRYPTSDYADLARERMVRLAGRRSAADFSSARIEVIGVPSVPAIPSSRTTEPNDGDGFFIRRLTQ